MARTEYLLDLVGPGRLMYAGDDLPACADRGKYITWGEAWTHGNADILGVKPRIHCDSSMTFIRCEALRAPCRAIRRQQLGSAHWAIFHDTAQWSVAAARRSVAAAG